ncbi:MAG: hypothetical protein WBA74_18240 [Cyclobacteriaceae bacterium]
MIPQRKDLTEAFDNVLDQIDSGSNPSRLIFLYLIFYFLAIAQVVAGSDSK